MATWVTSWASSQSRKAKSSAAVVPKVCTCCSRVPFDPGTRTQAATVCLCTSSPHTRSISRSIVSPPRVVSPVPGGASFARLCSACSMATMRGADSSHVRLFADSRYQLQSTFPGIRRAVSIDDFHDARVCPRLMAIIMNNYTHQTAPTQFVEANRIRFAYRRFGKTGGVPLVFSQHYIGTMDYWDPTVTDGLARDREVILFNNAGVSSSSGEVPTTFEQMGANAIAFIKALGLKQVDLFGFSIGGMVVQEITLQAPDLVRRLIVDGAGPRGGQGMELIAQATGRLFGAHPHDPPDNVWLAVKFSPSAAGQAAGREFLKRTHRRQEGRDPEVNDKVSPAQVEAIVKWGVQQKGASDYLKTIKQPTLVVNGSNDVNIPTVNSFIMQQNMPNAQLIIYPDSNHGAHHQYPELFIEHATLFLNA